MTKRIPRNSYALAAKSRRVSPMKHRLEPKKGATNKQQEYLSCIEEVICFLCDGSGMIDDSYCECDIGKKLQNETKKLPDL